MTRRCRSRTPPGSGRSTTPSATRCGRSSGSTRCSARTPTGSPRAPRSRSCSRSSPRATSSSAASTTSAGCAPTPTSWCGGTPPPSEELQAAYHRFRRTSFGRRLAPVWSQLALHRPAEFNRSHVPAFLADEEAKAHICVYPFVRSYEWYLLEESERRQLLAEHGQMARDYKDVRANTVASFALGDYEWILAFEADELLPDRRPDAAPACARAPGGTCARRSRSTRAPWSPSPTWSTGCPSLLTGQPRSAQALQVHSASGSSPSPGPGRRPGRSR